MASLTVAVVPTFPSGSTIGIYTNDGGAGRNEPAGTVIDTALVNSAGTATFDGVSPSTSYVIAAQISGEWRRMGVTTDATDEDPAYQSDLEDFVTQEDVTETVEEYTGGRQLAYAQAQLPSYVIGSNSTTWVDATGIVTGDFEVGSRPIRVEVDSYGVYGTSAGAGGEVRVYDTTNSKVRAQWAFGVHSANVLSPFCVARTLPSLDEGTYNFKVQIHRSAGSGTVNICSYDDGTPQDNEDQPCSIRVVEG